MNLSEGVRLEKLIGINPKFLPLGFCKLIFKK